MIVLETGVPSSLLDYHFDPVNQIPYDLFDDAGKPY
jgi:hypothetical protein